MSSHGPRCETKILQRNGACCGPRVVASLACGRESGLVHAGAAPRLARAIRSDHSRARVAAPHHLIYGLSEGVISKRTVTANG